MPATESTWYNMKLMHRIFAVSGVVLTLCTIWMFYKDHYRSWKTIQDTNVRADVMFAQMRKEQFETDQVRAEVARLAIEESQAKALSIDSALVTAFESQLLTEKIKLPDQTARLQELKEDSSNAAEARTKAQAARAAADAKLDDPALQTAAKEAEKSASELEEDAAALRAKIVDTLQDLVNKAKIREAQKLQERKFQSAYVDKAKADLDIAIRDTLTDEMAARQQKIDAEREKFDKLNTDYQRLSAHRLKLEEIVRQITAPVDAAAKALADSQAAEKRLDTVIVSKREGYVTGSFPWYGPGKDLLNLPILDAFGATRKPENLWSEGLLQDYNHAKVRRFDRCTTCHGSMQKSQPGEPTSPLFSDETLFEVVLTPRTAEEIKAARLALKKPEVDEQGKPIPYTLDEYLGVKLADHGLLKLDDVIVKFVEPRSPGAAAKPVNPAGATQLPTGEEIQQQVASGITPVAHSAVPNKVGLLLGDVIEAIDGSDLLGQNRGAKRASATLIDLAAAGQPFKITIRRGLPHPYNTHPRLDLFLSDSSPHKMGTFACTICHEGQGSATEFKWASHTPNDEVQASRWAKDSSLGWFNNHHWIYPMYPKRFTEATCLKCHHDVVELEPSQKFPDPPAEKLMHGYHLIRKYGCYGCHEVNGYDGPAKRIGPDLRLEPNFFAAAQQLTWEAGQRAKQLEEIKPASDEDQQALTAILGQLTEMTRLAAEVTRNPEENAIRRQLLAMIDEDQASAAGKFGQTLTPEAQKLSSPLRDVEAPGTLRKSGPSLRFVGQKVDIAFLYDWIWNPRNFRDNTRMPRFFGLTDHLNDEKSKHVSEDLEPIEVRGLVAFLFDRSQKFEPVERPEGVADWTDEEMITRGKLQFETRGCLACHTHNDFPDTKKFRGKDEIVQGPDLTNIGAKFSRAVNEQGPTWLYSWIKEPTKYHARTVMPNLFLEPLKQKVKDAEGKDAKDADGKDIEKVFDPAEDITTYLLADSHGKWKPVRSQQELTAPLSKHDADALRDLTTEYMREAFFIDEVERPGGYYDTGLPESMRAELKGAETELITADKRLTDAQRLRYIGLKTVSKYGCYGCHDIPGFEDAKPIGTQLQNWGRKDPSRLAFEHITHYTGGHGHAGGHDHAAKAHAAPATTKAGDTGHAHSGDSAAAAKGHDHAQATEMVSHKEELPVGFEEYYDHQLQGGSRIGFIYQKLKEPRSYDFDKTLNKRFNERLRMPQFPFSAADREAVITFVLGLVAEPPREKYLYRANPRAKAIAEGKLVLEKFNCGGCHTLEADKWKLSYTPGTFEAQTVTDPVYPFLQAHYSPAELTKAGTPDASNLLHSTLLGFPKTTKAQGLPELVDLEDGELVPEERYDPRNTKLSVDLVQPAVLGGNVHLAGLSKVSVPGSTITNAYTGNGGMLTRYLLPRVTAIAQETNPNASGGEAYGWLPPPLFGEGSKVQSNWLYEFLLEPYPIRPAVFLRMPKFNLSRDDATRLVNYFAAVDNANYPYEATPMRLDSHLAALQTGYAERAEGRNRLDDAMKIVIDRKNFCAQCHIIADFDPGGNPRAKGPNLADVYRRLRPDYLRNWIANPKMILPYTGMPVNFTYEPHLPQPSKLPPAQFLGNSEQTVHALVDLLMNYDQYSQGKNLIAPQIPDPPPEKPATDVPAAGANN